MTRANRHRELDTLSGRIDRAADIVPTVFASLDEQRTFVNALRAGSTDSGPGQKGTVSDPTQRTALALDTLGYKRKAITDMIATLGKCIDALESECAKALGYRVPEEMQGQRCGYSWTVLDRGLEIEHQCVNYAEYTERPDGSIYWRDHCSAHRKKVQRERMKQEDAA